MNDWSVPYSILRLVVLGSALVAIPTLVWRRVGGKAVSYAAILLGVGVLLLGEAFHAAAVLNPGWSAAVATIGGQFPIYAAGFILVLVGFLALMQDIKALQVRDRRTAVDERARAETARFHEARLKAILNGATDYCIITCDTDGLITSYSEGGSHILGWSPEEAVGKMNVATLHSAARADGAQVAADIFRTVKQDGRFEAELQTARKDGAEIPMLLTVTPLRDLDGNLEGYVSVRKDITEMKAARDALRHERDFVRGIIETNELFIVGVSLADGRVTLFNHGAERISGYGRDDVIGRGYADVFLPPDDRPRIHILMAEVGNGRQSLTGQHDSTIITKSGERRLIAWTYHTSRDAAGRPCHSVGFGRDVTEQRQMQTSLEKAKAKLEEANAALARMATTDYLTGLLNRRQADLLFEREIARCRRSGQPLAVILLDLDRFKSINDAYGHEAGDVCLKHVADRLRDRLRTSDIVARYGGEEFLLVLPETDRDAAATLADTICRRIAENPITHGDLKIRVAASAGVAVLDPGLDIPSHELASRADQAMYHAKRLGGNRAATWQEIHEDTLETTTADAE